MRSNGTLAEPPIGYLVIAERKEICPNCGQTFHTRISITPDKMVVRDRTRCLCSPTREQEQAYLAERMNKRVGLYFGQADLLRAPGPTLLGLEPRTGQEQAIETLRKLCEETHPKRPILLYGPAGRGKTFLALAFLRELAAKLRLSALAVRAIDMFAYVRQDMWNREKPQQCLTLLRQVDLLLIDDIGAEKVTDSRLEVLYSIVDYRYDRKTTVFTSNLTGKEMETRLGKPITSRIWGGVQVPVTGRDWRIA